MRRTTVFSLVSALVLAACGEGTGATGLGGDPVPGPTATPSSPAPSSGTTAKPPPGSTTPAKKSGALLFATAAPITGVAYEAGASKGTTDAQGAFTYEDGQTVTFRIGGTSIGTAPGAAVLSPYQLAGSSTCDDTDAVQKLVALLEALDADGNAANGITVPAGATAMPTKPLPALDVALRTFITAFDGEAWTQGTKETFAFADAIVRGQGVATDGTSWFFSGTTGLEKTSASFVTSTKNVIAIPLALAAQGSDHIGDIDIYNGKIYAPVEDKTYAAPKVVLYDAASLNSGTVFDVPWNLQTKGVPWIAVDGPRGVAYMAEWDPTPELHVFSLATMAYSKAIPLSTTVGRIQGGKVWRGQLYLSSDDATKHIYKVHLASGTVMPLFELNDPSMEEEGLVFFARPDGSLLHTLDVPASRTAVELRHHHVTREPLRWKVCP